jgi:hypothetical protein
MPRIRSPNKPRRTLGTAGGARNNPHQAENPAAVASSSAMSWAARWSTKAPLSVHALGVDDELAQRAALQPRRSPYFC